MVPIDITYTGQLHCSAVHLPSGALLATDAPRDNQGLGQAFSPTDLLAASLGTCILTTMAISLRKHNLVLDGARVHVEKEMTAPPTPRRIARLTLRFTLPASIPPDHRPALEHAAHACPVHRSIHPHVQMDIAFQYE